MNDNAGLSAKQQAVLEKLLKGKVSGEFKTKSIPKRKTHSPVPLSFSQQRLWVLDRLVPGNPFYNLPTAVELQGEIDLEVFERSLNEIIRRHESLRTVFTMENEEPVQVILPELNIKIETVDLRDLPPSEGERETERLMAEEASKPFDLEHGPLLRLTLIHTGQNGDTGEGKHVLLYTIHHIISDTWSQEIFVKELAAVNAAFSRGLPSPLPEIALQYADFAAWQRERLKGEILEKQLGYWRELLGGELPILELPADRQRPAVSTYRGKLRYIAVPEHVTANIITVSRQEKASMFMTLLAAFNVLLCRYTGQEDIMVGSPIANRTRPELEKMIGFFANTLVFRTDLSGNPTFRRLLKRVQAVTSGAYDNQDIPFEKLVEEFQPDRYMSHTPLFQVMFVLQNVPPQEVKQTSSPSTPKERVSVSDLPIHSGTSKFDLWLSLTETGSTLNGAVEYSTDIFEDHTALRLIGHFESLLEQIAGSPDIPIQEIDYLSSVEKEQILYKWNDTAAGYHIRCLHRMFEEQVERTPGATALIFEERALTFAELNAEANRLAHCLIESGVVPDMPVGVCMERSIELVATLMGILKAGCAYLPLDPEYPPDRLAFMAADSGISLLLTGKTTREAVPSFTGQTICFDEALSQYPAENPGTVVDTEHLAYIIYTSGSTGKPKGVPVPHRGISNRLQWMQQAYGLTAEDRVLQKTPFSFDVSVWEFFWPLLFGAVCVEARPGGHKDSAYLVEVIHEKEITTVHFVPTMLNVFLEEPGVQDLRTLKRVICSGEALAPEYRDRFFQRLKGVELHNLYGPTEASVDVTAFACREEDLGHIVPIGKPIADTRVYILDPYFNIVPVGVHGELYIGGIQVARGYLNRPEFTEEKFCLRQPGALFEKTAPGPHKNFCFYKTGDLVRWLPDGSVEFIGRLDFQVKVRGFRIELGEIESHLRQHEGIRDAVVLAKEAPGSGSKKLAAYTVPDHDYCRSHRFDDSTGDLSGEQVGDWEKIFDTTYIRDHGQEDPTFNIIGWNSSFTGSPIPAEEMRLWVDNTTNRILSLKPENVMEIGCGTGLFLFKIIPHCQRFLGTDIALEGLDYIRRQLELFAGETRADVELMQRSADNFEGIPADSLDLVILNSVIQYFPSVEYLTEVLTGAAGKIKPGGHIFIGDVRSLPLLKTFHAAVEFHKAGPGDTRETVLRRVANRIFLEQELVLDPGFFTALTTQAPRIKEVELLVKYGRYSNELSKFRYDVVLHIGDETGDNEPVSPVRIFDWPQGRPGITEIREMLHEMNDQAGAIVLTRVPNKRVSTDLRVLNWLTGTDEPGTTGEFRRTLEKYGNTGFDPDDFLEAARDLTYRASVTLPADSRNNDPGCCDVIFTHHALENRAVRYVPHDAVEVHSWHTYANNPLLAKISGKLVPELRDYLGERLPEYMVPSNFILLDRLPFTANGKLDRNALLLYDPVLRSSTEESDFVEPQTDTEKLFARIWKDVLFLDTLGINDNFFRLGGDSINAIQVISRANKSGYSLSVRDIYMNMTVERLARHADKTRNEVPPIPAAEEEPTVKIDRDRVLALLPEHTAVDDIYPLTPFQKHMLFHWLYNPTNSGEYGLYVNQVVFRMPLSIKAVTIVEAVFRKLTDIYPYLRTAFLWENLEQPVQVIHRHIDIEYEYRDLTQLSAETRENEVKKVLRDDLKRGFQREKPNVYRLCILRIAGDDCRIVLTSDLMRVDGWSAMIVMQKFIQYSFALTAGQELTLETDTNYKEYLTWLSKQDDSGSEETWKRMVEGCTVPTPLSSRIPGNAPGPRDEGRLFDYRRLTLSRKITVEIESFLKEHQLVLSALGCGVWTMLLHHYTAEESVIFGVLFSGRGSALAVVESMIGQAMNILPARFDIFHNKPVLLWLKELWSALIELNQLEFTHQDNVRKWWNIPQGNPLFESYLVVENFPGIKGDPKDAPPDDSEDTAEPFFEYLALMEHPLLRVELFPSWQLGLTMQYYLSCFSDDVISRMMNDFHRLLLEIVRNPRRTITEFMEFLRRP